MVVDDQYDIVHVIRRHLEKWGYSVDTFTNPLFALRMFKENPSRYAMVLTDLAMPEMRGTRLAKLMLEVKPDLKVVVMTAYEIEPDDLAMSIPAMTRDEILRKPFSLVQVCGAVKKQLKVA